MTQHPQQTTKKLFELCPGMMVKGVPARLVRGSFLAPALIAMCTLQRCYCIGIITPWMISGHQSEWSVAINGRPLGFLAVSKRQL
jgi:hypothetical protein